MKFKLFKKPICNAPFTSMYFRPDGTITPCCFNTEFIYGKYPENTVKQIWNGKEIKALRKAMLHNNLSHGCRVCEQHLINHNSEAAGFHQYSYLKIKKNPTKLELELSQKCNLNCIMCFQSKCNQEKEIYDGQFIKQISEYLSHVEYMDYIGGEPFINDLYFQIWDIIVEKNINCINIIHTNGTIWNNRIKQLLENGKFQLSISLDSVNKDIYEKIRINAKLEKTLKNINYFINSTLNPEDNIMINVCPMRNNDLNVTEIIKYTSSIRSKIYFNTVYTPYHLSLIGAPLNELKSTLRYYQDFLIEYKNITEQNKASFIGLINQLKSFIVNKEILDSKITLNYQYSEVLELLMKKLSPLVSNNEKHMIKNKLNAVFSSLLIDFPVVSGINLILKNDNIQFMIDLVLQNEPEYISEHFINFTIFSMI